MFSFDSVLEKLNERGFIARGFRSPEEAADAVLGLIAPEESVGFGGSVTVRELLLYDRLKERGNTVLWHWFDNDPDVRKKALLADVYLTSTNALTEGGELVNTDGGGNRVAAMFYGPKRCIVIAGKNKIVPGYGEALTRIKTVACPQNARRLGLATPCADTGICGNCDKSLRMCRVTVRYSYPMIGRDTYVFLVDSDLGF